jgi:hypothetical protein
MVRQKALILKELFLAEGGATLLGRASRHLSVQILWAG